MQQYFNPEFLQDPRSFELPWCQRPDRKVTIEDVKYVLSNHYQDTPYDPYGPEGTPTSRKSFRPIGINRTSQTAILHIRPNKPKEIAAIQWMAYGSMPFNTIVPLFTQVKTIPDYFANTVENVSTDNFYWTNRLIAALADPHFKHHEADLEDYLEKTMAKGHAMLHAVEAALVKGQPVDLEEANQGMSDDIQADTQALLNKILFDASNLMTNRFSLSD